MNSINIQTSPAGYAERDALIVELRNKLRAEEDRHAGNYEQWMETENRLRAALHAISRLNHLPDDRKTVEIAKQIARGALSDKA